MRCPPGLDPILACLMVRFFLKKSMASSPCRLELFSWSAGMDLTSFDPHCLSLQVSGVDRSYIGLPTNGAGRLDGELLQ